MPLTETDIDNAVIVDRASFLLTAEQAAARGAVIEAYALIILNQPINDLDLLDRVWKSSTIRACADGGANRLFDALTESTRIKYKPDFIAGDLDSLRKDVQAYYESQGVPVYHSPDQYSTDFGKCLMHLSRDGKNEHLPIVALGGTGGRVDQQFHSIHTLFVHEVEADENDSRPDHRKRKVTLLSDDSLTFLVLPGTSKIYTPRSVVGPTCGLIPILGETIISIKDFTWDVEDWHSSFGSQVSTSNAMESDDVYVKCDKTIVFTVEIRR
ncbi:thiamine pyrophosphokinase [Lipomyces oligophaga]|uniref:thiamine pyrophosphokinase n=1 Tax=Lipomyces oligophaga TaxID=45792 RepID=UPI0034CF2A0C